jgi:hypothetical protein
MNSGYRKLTPKRRTIGGFSQVWLGEDHLLAVHSVRFVERYQRFFFADIQAIIIGDGPDRRGWQAAATLISILWMCFATITASSFARGFFIGTGLIGVAFVIRDVIRGPRRRCIVQTAVSRALLTAVNRRKTERKFLDTVAPLIAAAQTDIPIADRTAPSSLVTTHADASDSGFSFTQASGAARWPTSPLSLTGEPYSPTESAAQPPPLLAARSYLAEILFGILILDSALMWWSLGQYSMGLSRSVGYLLLIYFAELSLSAATLIHRTSRPSGIALALVGLTIPFTLVDAFTVSGAAGWFALMNSVRLGSNRATLNSIWLSPQGTLLFAVSWRVVLGLGGEAAVWLDGREGRR